MNTMQKNDEGRPEMDDLLRDYFKAEMPHPWPAFNAPRPMRTKCTTSLWSRSAGRLALAACIALLVASYLALGGFFPRSQGPTGVQQINEIGMRDRGPKVAPVPQSNQAEDPMPMPTPIDEITKHKSQ